MDLPNVNPGDLVKASDINNISDAVRLVGDGSSGIVYAGANVIQFGPGEAISNGYMVAAAYEYATSASSATQSLTTSFTYHASRHAAGGSDPITPASIGAVPESRFLTGTGFPEGVVAAPPGTEYTDTAGTNGAWRWLKKTGTGTTGWSVIHGDTGWRAIPGTGWLPNSGAGATANITSWRVRRIGNAVHVKSRLRFTAPSAGSGAPSSGTIPPGWRPALDTVTATLHQWTQPNAPGGQWAPSIVGTTYVFAPVVTSNDLILTTSYLTDDPWPATLPGTPV